MRIKVLHAFIISAVLFLMVRVADISQQAHKGVLAEISNFFSSSTVAQEAQPADKANNAHNKAEAKKAKTKSSESTEASPPAEGEATGEAKSKKSKSKKEPEAETPEEPPVSIDAQKKFTPTEVEILERLSERRDRLDKWEADLQVKENVLKITEQRIDKKLDELRGLKKEVEASLAEYNRKEDEKTKSLVKIYENMKSKPAADILSKMDMQSLMPIMSLMKEKSAAEILSKMDPERAEQITSRLSELGRLKKTAKQ